MKIISGKKRFKLKNSEPLAEAILMLVESYAGSSGSVPERNDVKQLWRDLNAKHRQFLVEIAKHPMGVSQTDLESILGLDWRGLRGVHNGLARISEGSGMDKPVRVVGYNSTNRRYLMDPDVAATVGRLTI